MSRTEREFPKKRDKPFKMLEPTEELNPRLIANINPDALYYQGDLDQAQQALKNFVSSNLPEKMNYEMFSKLFRLSQLAIEYYTQEQEREQAEIEESRQEFEKLKEEHSKLNEFKQKHALKKQEYKEQLSVLESKMKEMTEESLKIGAYKCLYCSKCYREHDALDAHLKRRHLDLLEKLIDKKDMRRAQVEEALKRTPEEQLKEQNRLQMKKMREIQEMIAARSKPSEVKLVEQVSKQLQSDLDLRLSILTNQSQIKESQSRVIQKKDEGIQVTLNLHKKDDQENKDAEDENNKVDQGTVVKQETEVEKDMKESILKMNQNIELFNKAFQQIQEKQDKLSQQQEQYSKQLGQIVEGQEQLKKSQLTMNILNKNNGQNNQQNNYQGNMVSMKSAPFIASSQNKIDGEHVFPLQPVITAQFQNNTKKFVSKNSFEINYEKPNSQRKVEENQNENGKEFEGQQIQENKKNKIEDQNIHMPRLEMVLNAGQDGIQEVELENKSGKRTNMQENNNDIDNQISVSLRNSSNMENKTNEKKDDDQYTGVAHSRRSSRKISKGVQSNKSLEGTNELNQAQDINKINNGSQGQENKLDNNNKNIIPNYSNQYSQGNSEETSILHYVEGNRNTDEKNRFSAQQTNQLSLNQQKQGDGLSNETVVYGSQNNSNNQVNQEINSSNSLRNRKNSKNQENSSKKDITGDQNILAVGEEQEEEEQKKQPTEEQTEQFGLLQRQDRVDIGIDWQKSWNMDNMQRSHTEEDQYNHGMLDNGMGLLLVGNSELKDGKSELVQNQGNDQQEDKSRRLSQGIKENQNKEDQEIIEELKEEVDIGTNKMNTQENEQRKGSEKVIDLDEKRQENQKENSGSKDKQIEIPQIQETEETQIILPLKEEDNKVSSQYKIGNYDVFVPTDKNQNNDNKLVITDNLNKIESKGQEQDDNNNNKHGQKQDEQIRHNQEEEITELDIKRGWKTNKNEDYQKEKISYDNQNISSKSDDKENDAKDQLAQGKLMMKGDNVHLENIEKLEEDQRHQEELILKKDKDKDKEEELMQQLKSENDLNNLKDMEKQRKQYEENEMVHMQKLENQMVEEENMQKIQMEELPLDLLIKKLKQNVGLSSVIEQSQEIDTISENSKTKLQYEDDGRDNTIPRDLHKLDGQSNAENDNLSLNKNEDNIPAEKTETKKLNGVFEEIEDF